MIIVGERINTSRRPVQDAVARKDSAFIQKEARDQSAAGAAYIDVNCGLSGLNEIVDMEWLVNAVQGAVDTPLCIDSPDPKVIQKGVSLAKGRPLINSITAEEHRYKDIIPLALKHGAGLIALTMDKNGMPDTAEARASIAAGLLKILNKEGINSEDVYFDPLVRPISSEPAQAQELLRSIPMIKALGPVKILCGVSNISFGLPRRLLLNSTFLALAISAGLDGALIDPLNSRMIAPVRATEALAGKDKYCMNYIQGHRKGLY
jgi:5-methyltetrahydrofolate--homocysteine methyltransferase